MEEAIGYGMDFAARISAPLFSQLNTEKIGDYSRALAIGEEYGHRLLERYTKWQDKDTREIILDRLIRRYPSHTYIIDVKELQNLGFDATSPTNEEIPIINKFVDYVVKASQTEIQFVCEEKKKKQSKKPKKETKNGKTKNMETNEA